MSQEQTTKGASVVWLVNEGGHDYTALNQYGRVIPLTRGNVNPFSVDRHLVTIGPRLQAATAEDYVAISGLPILNMVVGLLWLSKFPKMNILQYSMKKEEYVFIQLSRAAIDKNASESGASA